MKIAVFLPNWLGDVTMATPVLRAVRRRFGADARIVGVMRPYLRDVLGGMDWLSEQWYFDPRGKDSKTRRWAVARRLRRERFDLALLLPNSFSSALTAWLGGVRQRIGYVRQGRGALLTGKIAPPRKNGRVAPEPMVDYYLRLAAAIGCPPESPRLELATTAADERAADGVWRRLGLRTDGRVILCNSSAAHGKTKLWPVEHFAELARRVVDCLDHDVLMLCGPNERDIARHAARLSGSDRVFSMAEQPLDIGTAKACMRRGRLMVSTDSGPRHVAAALGKPVVTMFGPTLPVWSENPTQKATNLVLGLDCIGCNQRTCPLGHHRCMRGLSVDVVFREVERLLRTREATADVGCPSEPQGDDHGHPRRDFLVFCP